MCFMAAIFRPLRSKRATISPVRPRSKASGFTRIRVRSKSSSIGGWRRTKLAGGRRVERETQHREPPRDGGQGCRDVIFLMEDLPVGETDGRQARCGMPLVAEPVHALLRRRAVEAQAVGLDDQAELGPEEIHPATLTAYLRPRLRQPGRVCD